MATLGDLKTRVATEMVRDDLLDTLAPQLALHISQAMEYFANEPFWFNAIVTTGDCTASAIEMDVPSTVRRVDTLKIPAQFQDVEQISFNEFEALCASTGVPRKFCTYNEQIRLWPTPGAVYTLQFSGIAQITPPSTDGDSNVWTIQGYDLIAARTRMTLYRDLFRDADGATMAVGATAEALSRLNQETSKRNDVPMRPLDCAPGQRRYSRFASYFY